MFDTMPTESPGVGSVDESHDGAVAVGLDRDVDTDRASGQRYEPQIVVEERDVDVDGRRR